MMKSIKAPSFKNFICFIILICFSLTSFDIQPVQAQEIYLPKPGAMVSLSQKDFPPILKGIKLHPGNPFRFDFILDMGDSSIKDQSSIQKESAKLIKYFLAALTIPEKDLWVNLSPYEKDRIIANNFGDTLMGEKLLSQDYLLKQLTASIIYPEKRIGKVFWRKVYEAVNKQFGTTSITVNTFNKVWIMPDKASVFESPSNNSAIVVHSSLKVMLEEDYLALNKNHSEDITKPEGQAHSIASAIVREIIIPQLTKEVNEGKNFSELRQIYNSLILAIWYKNKLRESLLGKGYINQGKISGVEVGDKNIKEEIFHQYIKSFKKGVFNYIKEEIDPLNNVEIPRKYFSGGVSWEGIDSAMVIEKGPYAQQEALFAIDSKDFDVKVSLGALDRLNPSMTVQKNVENDTGLKFKGDFGRFVNQGVIGRLGDSHLLVNMAQLSSTSLTARDRAQSTSFNSFLKRFFIGFSLVLAFSLLSSTAKASPLIQDPVKSSVAIVQVDKVNSDVQTLASKVVLDKNSTSIKIDVDTIDAQLAQAYETSKTKQTEAPTVTPTTTPTVTPATTPTVTPATTPTVTPTTTPTVTPATTPTVTPATTPTVTPATTPTVTPATTPTVTPATTPTVTPTTTPTVTPTTTPTVTSTPQVAGAPTPPPTDLEQVLKDIDQMNSTIQQLLNTTDLPSITVDADGNVNVDDIASVFNYPNLSRLFDASPNVGGKSANTSTTGKSKTRLKANVLLKEQLSGAPLPSGVDANDLDGSHPQSIVNYWQKHPEDSIFAIGKDNFMSTMRSLNSSLSDKDLNQSWGIMQRVLAARESEHSLNSYRQFLTDPQIDTSYISDAQRVKMSSGSGAGGNGPPLPIFAGLQIHYNQYPGTLWSPIIKGGTTGLVANVGLNIPGANYYQDYQMLSHLSQINALGAASLVNDLVFNPINADKLKGLKGSSWLIDGRRTWYQGVLALIYDNKTIYGANDDRVLVTKDTGSIGALEVTGNASLDTLLGKKPLNLPFMATGKWQYKYGPDEIKTMIRGVKGESGKYVVISEHALPNDLDELKSMSKMIGNPDKYYGLAKKGFGFAVGMVYDPKNPNKIEYAFISLRQPGQFTDGHNYVVESNQEFKDSKAAFDELKKKDSSYAAIAFDRRFGTVVGQYRDNDIPTQSNDDIHSNDPTKPVLLPTLRGVLDNYWLYHTPDNSPDAPSADQIPIGRVTSNDGKTATYYYGQNGAQDFRAASSAFKTPEDRVVYGTNYQDPLKGQRLLVNPLTGEERVVTGFVPIVYKSYSVYPKGVNSYPANPLPQNQTGLPNDKELPYFMSDKIVNGPHSPPTISLAGMPKSVVDYLRNLEVPLQNFNGVGPVSIDQVQVNIPTTADGWLFIPSDQDKQTSLAGYQGTGTLIDTTTGNLTAVPGNNEADAYHQINSLGITTVANVRKAYPNIVVDNNLTNDTMVQLSDDHTKIIAIFNTGIKALELRKIQLETPGGIEVEDLTSGGSQYKVFVPGDGRPEVGLFGQKDLVVAMAENRIQMIPVIDAQGNTQQRMQIVSTASPKVAGLNGVKANLTDNVDDFLKTNVLVISKGKNPTAQFISADALNDSNNRTKLLHGVSEIQSLDVQGKAASRFVPMYQGGFQEVKADQDSTAKFYSDHVLVVWSDGTGEFIDVNQLKQMKTPFVRDPHNPNKLVQEIDVLGTETHLDLNTQQAQANVVGHYVKLYKPDHRGGYIFINYEDSGKYALIVLNDGTGEFIHPDDLKNLDSKGIKEIKEIDILGTETYTDKKSGLIRARTIGRYVKAYGQEGYVPVLNADIDQYAIINLKNHQSVVISMQKLNSLNDQERRRLLQDAQEIIRIGQTGKNDDNGQPKYDTVGRYVRMHDQTDFRLIHNDERNSFLEHNALIVWKDGRPAEFINLNDLNNGSVVTGYLKNVQAILKLSPNTKINGKTKFEESIILGGYVRLYGSKEFTFKTSKEVNSYFIVPMADGPVLVTEKQKNELVHLGILRYLWSNKFKDYILQSHYGFVGYPKDSNGKSNYGSRAKGQNTSRLFSVPNIYGGVDFMTLEEVFSLIVKGEFKYEYQVNPTTHRVVIKDGQPVMILKNHYGIVGVPKGFSGFPQMTSLFVAINKDSDGHEKGRKIINADQLKNYVGNLHVSIVRVNEKGDVIAYINLNPVAGETPSIDIIQPNGEYKSYEFNVGTGKVGSQESGYVRKASEIKVKDVNDKDMDVTVYERHLENGIYQSAYGIITHSNTYDGKGLDAMKGEQYVEFFPTEFSQGKPIAGLAIVGPADSTSRNIYTFGLGYRINKDAVGLATTDNISLSEATKNALNIQGHVIRVAKQSLEGGKKNRWFIIDETTQQIITIDPIVYGRTDQDKYYVAEVQVVNGSKTYLLHQTGASSLNVSKLMFDTNQTPSVLTQDQMNGKVGVLSGKLNVTINNIRSEIGLSTDKPIEFIESVEKITGNGTHITYRIKGDPLARVVVYRSSAIDSEASVIVNTSFNEQTPTKGYELNSLKDIYFVEYKGNVSHNQLIDQWHLRDIPGFDVNDKRLAFNQFDQFNKINRYRLIAGLSNENLRDPVLVRYLPNGDPLSIDAIKEDRGAIRFMMYQSIDTGDINKGLPVSVVSGEIAVQPDIKKVLRVTRFTKRVEDPDPANSYYEYAVDQFLRDGQSFGPNIMNIKYYYNTGKVVEGDMVAGTQLSGLDEIPLSVTQHNDLTSQNQMHSSFEEKAFEKGGHTYRYVREIDLKGTTDGEMPLETIYRDGKLFVTRKNGKISVDPYSTPTIWNRISNVFVSPTRDSENINELFNIANHGQDNAGKKYDVYTEQAPSEQPAGANVYREPGHLLASNTLWVALVGFLSIFTFGYWAKAWRNLLRKFRKVNGNAASLKDLSGIFGNEIGGKIVTFRSLNGPLPSLKKNIKGWEGVLNGYWTGTFTQEEIDAVKERIEKGGFEFREDFQDFDHGLDLVPIREIRDETQFENAISSSTSDIAASLNALNEAGVTFQEQFDLLKNLDTSRPSATVWTDLQSKVLNVFYDRLKEGIIFGRDMGMLANVPTPETRMLAAILRDDSKALELRAFIIKNKELPLPMIVERFVRQSTEEIADRILKEYFGEDLKTPLYQQIYKKEHIDGIIQELYTRFMRYPVVFMDALYNDDGKYKLDAITEGGEPVTVSEFVIYRTMELPRSAFYDSNIQEAKTMGAASVMAPQVLFVSKYLHYLNQENASNSFDVVGQHNAFWMHMLHINNWGFDAVPGLVKYITEPAEKGGKQIDLTLRDILYEGNIYDLFEYLNHQDIDDAVKIYEAMMKIAMEAMKIESPDQSPRKIDDMRMLNNEMKAIVNEFNDVNKMGNASEKEDKIMKLYNNRIKGLIAPFVRIVNERRLKESPWVAKLDEGGQSSGLLKLYTHRILPIFSRTWFKILTTTMGVKNVSSLRDIYGIEDKATQWKVRIFEAGIAAAGIAAGILTGYVAFPVLALGLVMLPRLMFGHVNNSSERWLWTGVFSAHTYIMALYAHHLFGKFASINVLSWGFLNTASLLVLLAPVTFLGIYQMFTMIKGYLLYVNSLAAPTARMRVSFLHLLKPPQSREKDDEEYYTSLYHDFLKAEEKVGYLTANRVLVKEHLIKLYKDLYRNGLISKEELENQMQFLNDPQNHIFVLPKHPKAREYIYTNMMSFAYKRPVAERFAYMTASGDHVQSGNELFTHTFERHAALGSINALGLREAAEEAFEAVNDFNRSSWVIEKYKIFDLDKGKTLNDLINHGVIEEIPATGLVRVKDDFLSRDSQQRDSIIQDIAEDRDQFDRIWGIINDAKKMGTREALQRASAVSTAYFTIHKQQDVRPSFFLVEAKKVLSQEEYEIVKSTIDTYESENEIKEASLFGYLAPRNGEAFNNIMELIREAVHDETGFEKFKEVLGDIGETTDVLDRFKKAIRATNFNNDQIAAVVDVFERFLNEIRPNNNASVQGMGETLTEHHLYAASEYGDMLYHKAVLEMADTYVSLPVAYNTIKEKISMAEHLSSTEEYFYRNYETYRETVQIKYKAIFQMEDMWKQMTRFFDEKSKTFKYEYTILKGDVEPGSLQEAYVNAFGDPARFKVIQQDGVTNVIFNELGDFSDAVLNFRKEHYLDLLGTSLLSNMKDAIQYSYDIKTCKDNDVYIPFYDKKLDGVIAKNKNGGIGTNLWASYERMSNYDAHVRIYKGQSTHRLLLQGWLSREPEYVIINPTFRIWSSSDDSFAGTSLYKISQETFTEDVQRSRRSLTSFYGKGFVLPAAGDSMLTPPGEDSAAFFTFQRSYPSVQSSHVPWMVWEWGRPSLLAESMLGTEMRYTFNVTRFLLDSGQYELFFNKKIGYDVKLTNMALFLHYLSAPLALVLLIAVPALQGFSAFAYLSPLWTFGIYSMVFMQAINVHNFMRHLRVTGNIWLALGLTVKEVVKAFPYYVSMLPAFARGALLAANDLFSFILSQKEGHLGQQLRQHRMESKKLDYRRSGLLGKGRLPFDGLVGIAGIAAWIFGAITTNGIGMFVTLPYLWASMSFLTGTHILNAFKDKEGNKMKGYSMMEMFGKPWGLPILALGIATIALGSWPAILIRLGIMAAGNALFWSGLGLTILGSAFTFSNVWQAIGWTFRDLGYFVQDVIKTNKDNANKESKDKAMRTSVPRVVSYANKEENVSTNRISKYLEPKVRPTGGIDLRKTVVDVDTSQGVIQTSFDDPAMLRLLLNSDGLVPIIDDIKTMTPQMKANFIGLN